MEKQIIYLEEVASKLGSPGLNRTEITESFPQWNVLIGSDLSSKKKIEKRRGEKKKKRYTVIGAHVP